MGKVFDNLNIKEIHPLFDRFASEKVKKMFNEYNIVATKSIDKYSKSLRYIGSAHSFRGGLSDEEYAKQVCVAAEKTMKIVNLAAEDGMIKEGFHAPLMLMPLAKLSDTKHGEREKIANEIIEAVEKICNEN